MPSDKADVQPGITQQLSSASFYQQLDIRRRDEQRQGKAREASSHFMACAAAMTAAATALGSAATITCPRIRHIITGTFNSAYLFLLSYDTLNPTLRIEQQIPARGPHQYLALGSTSTGPILYATTWAKNAEISAWRISRGGANTTPSVGFINALPIAATSSYVHVQPPPYTSLTSPSYGIQPGTSRHLYSAGGPTGELHTLDPTTGALREKTQELVFLREGREGLQAADKTRKALRYGSHNLDVSTQGLALVADLGRNAILAYERDAESGQLVLVDEVQSPDAGDGPRHVVPSPDGKWAFSVTEHTSYLDVYAIRDRKLTHVQRASVIPEGLDRHAYRGDTVRLSPDAQSVLASTRGMHAGTRGFVRAWALRDVVGASQADSTPPLQAPESPLTTYETPTSGGKANAIEFAPRYPLLPSSTSPAPIPAPPQSDLLILTDDERGHLLVLEWTGSDLVEKARTTLPALDKEGGTWGEKEGEAQGASHAIWVS